MATTLLDRVRAVGAGASAPARREAVEHDQAPAQTPEQKAAPHEDEATDSVLTWLRRYEGHFTEALPEHIDTSSFFAAVRAVLPQLRGCTPASVLQSLLTCARFGLIPDSKEAAVVADGPLAVFIPTYRGYVELMYRSGRVDSVHVGMVHEHDEWSYEPTAPAPLDFTHKPSPELPKAERGEPVLAYAFCWLKGGARSQVVLLSREDAEEIRDEYSRAYRDAEESGKRDSFWHTDFPAMWRKSALRRLEKVVPTSAEFRALVAADDAGEAGTPQILHAPDPEAAQLAYDTERAHTAAEASQDVPAAAPLPRKRAVQRRSQPKRLTRKGRKAKGRGRTR
ncbi:recombinase RecT [Streptomyces javensis]|uniref:recombinase RecT n=1 Tax=Streptomyces javensis TaxID=114698 RepID=UPI0033CF86FE